MSDSRRETFLAGELPEDIALYLADSFVDDLGRLEKYGERVADGIVVVVDGDSGRDAFTAATGADAMNFAKEAMGTEGTIAPNLTAGDCPDCDDGTVEYVFAFAEEQNEEVGGLYEEGDVIHAYARCDCGAAYSHKWVAGSR
ncbi:DUF5807 family protein [Haloarchaeobius iranensis]|uniref:Uncharacterized protein n=1 Tax=Haloarchaeobius iranensis TaxID=996166 RepID=A0A1G9ZG54_9EURY|nr:DUF5807 family protein [Haloarchaeobius iranensis]SDN20308.1 hypothetical protein SAMN05192554_12034 [Haloarchaeobius iranensis]